jgi:hypothetical protein
LSPSYRADVAGAGGFFALDEFEPVRPENALQDCGELAIARRPRSRPDVFGRHDAVGEHQPASDIDGRSEAFDGEREYFLIRRVQRGGCDSLCYFDLDNLIDTDFFERRGIGFVETFEFDHGELGEGELARLFATVKTMIVRFDFFVIPQEGALGSG